MVTKNYVKTSLRTTAMMSKLTAFMSCNITLRAIIRYLYTAEAGLSKLTWGTKLANMTLHMFAHKLTVSIPQQ